MIWHNINDFLPPCDGEIVFVGINTAGYCGCFNHYDVRMGMCLYETAEDCITIMSDLEWWAILEMPI